jgi:SRSO17 transposase
MCLRGIYVYDSDIMKEIGLLDLQSETVVNMLDEHVGRYDPYLRRKEQHKHMRTIIKGHLSDLDRKTIQPIGFAFSGKISDVDNMYHFMADALFNEDGMRMEYQKELAERLSHKDGMITGDGCDFTKKGKKSAGVAHQYNGNLGKRDNCQASVMVGYVSPNGHGLISSSLHLTEEWFGEDHADLRRECRIPENLEFETKNVTLSKSINAIWQSGQFEAKYIGVDSSFGRDHKFLDSLPEKSIYFADIPCNHHVFINRPNMVERDYSGRGRRPSKLVPSHESVRVDTISGDDSIPWNEVILGTGSKGPIIAKDKCVEVVEVRDGQPGKAVWLYIRQLENGKVKYSLCNESRDASIEDIRKPALMRWSIEQCFEECKTHLGMSHYETRTWTGWNRHMLFTFIAHLFVMKLIDKFSTKKNHPLETPVVKSPVPVEEYIEEVEKHQNNQPVDHKNVQVVAKAPNHFLTIGVVIDIINMFLIKSGDVIKAIGAKIANNASSYNSYSRGKIKMLLNGRCSAG